MVLPAPELDDRKFQDLVDETKRLIPTYCKEWTNHNLSDPGVALIELFAWMSEIVLYRLNQVPDRYYTKFLELVGIEPFAPSVARTHLTFWLSTVLEQPVLVPAGVVVATQAGSLENEVTFTTSRDLVITPARIVAAATATAGNDEQFIDVFDELRYPDGVVTCFTSDPIEPGDALYLGFDAGLGGNIIRLDISATTTGHGVDPKNPPRVWEAWTGETWVAAEVHADDTTGGLNRDGEVVLIMPMSHEPATLGGTRAWWLRVKLLDGVTGRPDYEASPRIRSIEAHTLGGTVRAEHAERIEGETLGRSHGGPGQAFAVARPPVLARSEDEHVIVIDDEGAHRWTEVDDFTRATETDRVYVWDGATGVIRFGPQVRYPDGSVRRHGATPKDGAEITVTGYRHGGGASGNVGAGSLTRLRTTVPYVDRVENLDSSTGGVDGETVENAKKRGPMTLRTGARAVTADDYERLSLEASSEVARARCLAPERPGGPVRVLLVPDVAVQPMDQQIDHYALSPELLERVATHLEERRVLGTQVEVSTPFYQGITVAALIQSQPGRPANLVRERVLDTLYELINPISGGFDGKGWPFEADANAAPIAQLLETVEGVERVNEVLLFKVDLRTGKRTGPGRDVIHLEDRSLFLAARHQVVVR